MGLAVLIAGGNDLSLSEVTDSMEVVTDACNEEANILYYMVRDEGMGDLLRVTIIAVGSNDAGNKGSVT
jgi:cell division protein FtsZ